MSYSLQSLRQLTPAYVSLRDKCLELLERGDKEKAEAHCHRLLNAYPASVEAHILAATSLYQNGKGKHAFPLLERASRIEPNNPHVKHALGHLYKHFRLYEFALPLLQAITLAHPENAEFQLTLANAYIDIGLAKRAQKHLLLALPLAKTPALAEKIKLGLLHTYVSEGQIDLARDLVAELIGTVKRENKMAVLRNAAYVSKDGYNSALGEEMRAMASHSKTPVLEKVELKLALGRMHEQDQDYDLAFAMWEEARKLSATQPWLVQPREKHLKGYRSFYIPKLFQTMEAYGHPSDVPVFVVGMPRSGTTLTEQIISAHPDVAGVGELGRWGALEAAFRKDYPPEARIEKMLANAQKGELKARAAETLNYLELVAEGKYRRIVEKTPHNFQAIGFHRLCFPKARFVHCRRHPIDTFISSYQHHFNQQHGYAFDQIEYLREWFFHENLMNYWKSLFPDQIFTLDYEELTSDPETWVRELIAFLDLPWDPQCLKYFEKSKSVKTFSVMQVRNPVYTSSVGRWRKYEKHLGPILAGIQSAGFEYKTGAQRTRFSKQHGSG